MPPARLATPSSTMGFVTGKKSFPLSFFAVTRAYVRRASKRLDTPRPRRRALSTSGIEPAASVGPIANAAMHG